MENIEWQEASRLDWQDYELRNSKSDGESMFALTKVFHSVRGGMKAGKPNFQVKVLFVKKGSWTTTYANSRLLAHEQLHFDLAELYGRKLRSTIASLGRQEIQDLKIYKARIERLLDEFKSKSLSYDEETIHGRIPEKQQEWQAYVAHELNRLSKYSNK